MHLAELATLMTICRYDDHVTSQRLQQYKCVITDSAKSAKCISTQRNCVMPSTVSLPYHHWHWRLALYDLKPTLVTQRSHGSLYTLMNDDDEENDD